MEKNMSQLQQLSLQQMQTRERYNTRVEEPFQWYEAFLLAQLFRRNVREDVVQTATPQGYGYVREEARAAVPSALPGPVVQVAAHPGDGPDFFYATYLKMTQEAEQHRDYHEILLTDGEGGVEGWSPDHTRRVRVAEAYAGSQVVDNLLHFLSYPDGSLSSLTGDEQDRLIATLAAMFGDMQPCLVVVHPPKNDHPDHASSFLLTLAALERHALAGGSLPTLVIHDVEFGLQQESLWTSPTADALLEQYPLHSPEMLIDISSTHQLAQYALHLHKTQMYDVRQARPKLYADLIDTLAQVRGLQFAGKDVGDLPRGQGFSQVVVPGVTNEQNVLPLLLPPGSVYRRTDRLLSEAGAVAL